MPTPTGKSTRAERLAQPLAREIAEQIAADKGACIRPVSLRRTDIATGQTEVIDVPCGSTLESRCPACAKRKRSLRRTQCEEGWHLTTEPVVEPDQPTEEQQAWVEQRAMVIAERDRLAVTGTASAEYLDYWLEHVVRAERRPKTVQGYEGVVRRYLVPGLGKKRLAKLTVRDVRTFVTNIRQLCQCCRNGTDAARDEPRCCALPRPECCGHRLSARMVQSIHAVLRNALQTAVREELIPRNVASLVKVSPPRYAVNRGLDVAQSRRLLKASENDRFHALYVLALCLGLRRGELLGLRWCDIDLEAERLEVVHTLQRVGGKLSLVPPKTEDSARTVPLPGICADALKAHRKRQFLERSDAFPDWEEYGLVFPSRRGTPLEPDNLRRSWEPLRRAASLEGMRFHDLRHTCVTLLLNLEVPPQVVREIVGHSDIGVTMTIYAHASLDDKRRALGKLGDALG